MENTMRMVKVSELKNIDWISKSLFFSNIDIDGDEDEEILIPSDVKLIPDNLENVKLRHVIKAVHYFMGEPEFLYEFLRKKKLSDYDNIIYDNNQEINKIIFKYKEFSRTRRDDIANWAASNGYLDILMYCKRRSLLFDSFTVNSSAEGGHVNCLIYLLENGCEVSVTACYKAALNGHLDFLKYLKSINCWNDEVINYCFDNVNCLRFVHENGQELNEGLFTKSIYNRNLKVVKYLSEHNCPNINIFKTCIFVDDLEIFEYLYNFGYIVNPSLCVNAAKESLDILKFLHGKGFRLDESAYISAYKVLNEEVIDFLLDVNVQLSANVCDISINSKINTHKVTKRLLSKAADENIRASIEQTKIYMLNGNLKMLKFLHKNGYVFDESYCKIAATKNYLDCLMFLHKVGTLWDSRTCEMAIYKKNLDCLNYAVENECPLSESCYSYAITNYDLETIIYLKQNKCPSSLSSIRFSYNLRRNLDKNGELLETLRSLNLMN